MHADELIRRYSAEPAVFEHKALLASVNRSAAESSLYEATRFAWRVDAKRTQEAEVILPTVQGTIVGAFVADVWLPATVENFPGREPVPGRFGFVGREAHAEVPSVYRGKRVPDIYRKPGAANPIKYTWT